MGDKIIAGDIRVLVVDDNMVNALVLSTMLEHYGIHADIAESGMEAIERVCGMWYDIILMDYLMPDMDGIETTRQIMFVSESKKKPKIIGVSATVDSNLTEMFKEAGAEGVLKKPVRAEDFEVKLKQFGFVQGEVADEVISEDGFVDSAAFLSAVEGLNYDEGLSLMAGSLDNYMKVLSVSVRNIEENYNKLDVIRNTEQMEIMALYFHSLKGIFLNIGADDLANASKMLEFAAKELENMYVHQQMDEYMADISKFHDQLDVACENYKQKLINKTSGVKMEEEEFASNLNALKESIENFEYIEITELLEKMLAGSEGERAVQLQSMYDYIQNFQYDEALAVLNRMY